MNEHGHMYPHKGTQNRPIFMQSLFVSLRFFESSATSGLCTRHSWFYSSCLYLYVSPESLPHQLVFLYTVFTFLPSFTLIFLCSLIPCDPPMSTFCLSSLILTFRFSVEQIDCLFSSSTEASLKAVPPLCCFEIQHSLTGRRPERQKSVNINKCLTSSLKAQLYQGLLFSPLWSCSSKQLYAVLRLPPCLPSHLTLFSYV